MNKSNVIIIGGGAAGMMAALSCKKHHPNYNVTILDRTFALGRKILVCGAGRCNVTNLNLNTDSVNRYHGADYSFVEPVLNKFGYDDIVNFFADLGVELYVERKTNIGKLFPITNQASTINELLYDELSRLNVKIELNTQVNGIVKTNTGFDISCNDVKNNQNRGFNCNYLIIATGGKSYPALGSNGTGYDLAKLFGHTIIEPVPSALPLESTNPLSHPLQGVRIDAKVSSVIDGKLIKTRENEVMITKYGFSGPAILDISREISVSINRHNNLNCQVLINFMPDHTPDSAMQFLNNRWNKRPNQTIEKSLYGLFPNKFAAQIVNLSKINPDTLASTLTQAQKNALINLLTKFNAQITDTRGWNEAEFTAGGVDSREINVGSLESKLMQNLFFCGEVIDVDGDVGGFNLSWSWASGFISGQLNTN